MSVQDLEPDLETTPEPDERVMRRLVRALDYSKGFWLGFAKSNTPAQRRRLSALCKDLLEPLKIRVLEVELNEPVTDLLPVLRERLAQEAAANDGEQTVQPKLAIFVHGLERSIPSREAYPPLLSALNLKRELFRQEVPHPLLLWLPDYALTALARKAPDFWAWRSGLYEFAPERDAAEESVKTLRGEAWQVIDNLSKQAKRERLIMLKGLLDDYRELGEGPREQQAQGDILNEIGGMHYSLNEWTEAKQAYEESLIISRNLSNDAGEAVALHNLANVLSYQKGEPEEAQRLYNESLKIKQRLNDQRSIALTIKALASVAVDRGRFSEAKNLLTQSLDTFTDLKDQRSVASVLYEMAYLAQIQGELQEARRLYGESQEIAKRLDNQTGVAATLHQLGRLAEYEGDMTEAARLYREALNILENLDSPYADIARVNLTRLGGQDVLSK